MVKRKSKTSFEDLSKDIEKTIIDNEVEERTNSLKIKMLLTLGFAILVVLGVIFWMRQSDTNQKTHYTKDELKTYIKSFESTEPSYDYQWTLEDYKNLTIDETGENGKTLDSVIKQFGKPRSTKVLKDFGGVNRIAITYEDNYYRGLNATLYFQNVKGTFRLYSKYVIGPGFTAKGIKAAEESDYKFLWTKDNYEALKNGTTWEKMIETYGKPSSVSLSGSDNNVILLASYGKDYKEKMGSISVALTLSGEEFIVEYKDQKGELW